MRLFFWYDRLYPFIEEKDLPPTMKYGKPGQQLLLMHRLMVQQEKQS